MSQSDLASGKGSSGGDLDVRFPAAGWIELTAPSREEYLDRIASLLDELAGKEVEETARQDLKMVVSEIASNAIEWGNRGDARRSVRISYALFDDEIVLKVEDEGEGFDPGGVPDPSTGPAEVVRERLRVGKRIGGFGIYVARKLMDSIVYSERGNAVLLSKSLGRA